MGYLIGEIWLWLLITFVIGLVIGWLIWGRGRAALNSRVADLERQAASAKAQCDACEAEKVELKAAADASAAQVAGLEKQVADATAAAQSSAGEVGRLSSRIAALEKERDEASAAMASAAVAGAASAETSAAAADVADRGAGDASTGVAGDDMVSLTDAAGDPAAAESADDTGVSDADRPDALSAPEGAKDDLKLISGVGPKLEGVLNELGIFHFWQIAKWTRREVAWVDDYLSFKGRIDRDRWIEQAETLASGGQTEFSSRNR